MMQDTWKTFPEQVVQKINGLLDEAGPNPAKAYQLYKMCQSESLWTDSFAKFSDELVLFFKNCRSDRAKSQVDKFLNRPMDCIHFEDFQLNFRTAAISSHSVKDVASWAHHMLRLHFKSDSDLISSATLFQTIFALTHPLFGEKTSDIDFDDFCSAWGAASERLFGTRFDSEQKAMLQDLRGVHSDHVRHQIVIEQQTRHLRDVGIYLTQTEIDWTTAVRDAAVNGKLLPKYPLTKGPDKEKLQILLQCATLYEIAFSSVLPRLVSHQPQIKATVLYHCDWLLTHKRS